MLRNCVKDHSRNPLGRGMMPPCATVATRPLTQPEGLTSVKRGYASPDTKCAITPSPFPTGSPQAPEVESYGSAYDAIVPSDAGARPSQSMVPPVPASEPPSAVPPSTPDPPPPVPPGMPVSTLLHAAAPAIAMSQRSERMPHLREPPGPVETCSCRQASGTVRCFRPGPRVGSAPSGAFKERGREAAGDRAEVRTTDRRPGEPRGDQRPQPLLPSGEGAVAARAAGGDVPREQGGARGGRGLESAPHRPGFRGARDGSG